MIMMICVLIKIKMKAWIVGLSGLVGHENEINE